MTIRRLEDVPTWLHWVLYLTFLVMFSLWCGGCASTQRLEQSSVGAETYLGSGVLESYKVTIDFESAVFQDAIARWNEVAGRELFVADDSGVGEVVVQLEDADHFQPLNDEDNVAYAESDGGTNCFVHVLADSYAIYMWQLYAHELGHCLGFQHSANASSLMFPTLIFSLHQGFTDDLTSLFHDNDLTEIEAP